MHPSVPALSILSAAAYLLFAIAGVALWKGTRSIAAALIAVGFLVVFIDQIILVISYIHLVDNFANQPGDTLFIVYHRANSPWVVLSGMWVAALGLASYAAVILRRQ